METHRITWSVQRWFYLIAASIWMLSLDTDDLHLIEKWVIVAHINENQKWNGGACAIEHSNERQRMKNNKHTDWYEAAGLRVL